MFDLARFRESTNDEEIISFILDIMFSVQNDLSDFRDRFPYRFYLAVEIGTI